MLYIESAGKRARRISELRTWEENSVNHQTPADSGCFLSSTEETFIQRSALKKICSFIPIKQFGFGIEIRRSDRKFDVPPSRSIHCPL